MADGITSTISGADLMKALEKFPINIQKNVMTGAVRAGANVVRDEARQKVRKRTRNLEKSIGTAKRKSPRSVVHFSVGTRKGGSHDGFYGRFLEFGTSKMQPYPFLRPSLESKKSEVIDATKDYIAQRIDKEVIKAKR